MSLLKLIFFLLIIGTIIFIYYIHERNSKDREKAQNLTKKFGNADLECRVFKQEGENSCLRKFVLYKQGSLYDMNTPFEIIGSCNVDIDGYDKTYKEVKRILNYMPYRIAIYEADESFEEMWRRRKKTEPEISPADFWNSQLKDYSAHEGDTDCAGFYDPQKDRWVIVVGKKGFIHNPKDESKTIAVSESKEKACALAMSKLKNAGINTVIIYPKMDYNEFLSLKYGN